MTPRIRVMIVDDHPVVRAGLADVIARSERLIAVGEGPASETTIEIARQARPDVVVLDLHEPEEFDSGLVLRFGQVSEGTKVLMFSASLGDEDVFRAVEAGARGYLPKTTPTDDLLRAIERVHGGGELFPEAVADKLAKRRLQANLSLRELEVLKLVVAGMSNKEIMVRMRLSEATVKLHLSNMLAKLGVTDRTQAAIAAVRRGIVHLNS